MDYRGRVAIVTGASSGIGRRVALDFAARGATAVAVARRGDRLDALRREASGGPGRIEPLVGDLTDRSFTDGVVPRALERCGRLDVLVNNAGVPKHKQIFDVTPEDVESTLRVNLIAPALLTLAALPPMLRRGEGWIVNISSVAGRVPPPREAVYAASKYGLTGFSEALWLDLEGSGIDSSVIHVGAVDTEIWERAAEDAPLRYRGRKHPPDAISRAVFACIEKRRPEMTVPGSLRLVFWLKALLPGAYRRGTSRYDPVPREVVDAARRAAGGAPGGG